MENNYLNIIKLKRLINKLNSFSGSGTSMVSLIIPSDKKIHDIVQRLTVEQNSVSNIKSSKNSKAVFSAIDSIKDRLKYYNILPKNGLVIYCGVELNDKKMLLDFEPPKPIKSFKYYCDSKFDTLELENMLSDDKTYGYIVIDGNGLLCAKLKGQNYEIIYKQNNTLPRKHNKGGQSSVRFERLYNEKKLGYIRKCCETINNLYINNEKINVECIIVGGMSNIKNKMIEDITLDQRIKNKILNLVDISSGGEQGLNILINLSKDTIKNSIYIYEKDILAEFYKNINLDAKNICIGYKDTVKYLDEKLIETIIIYEKFNKEINGENIIDWLLENCSNIKVIILECNTAEGNMFINGFGGICGYTHYEIENNEYNEENQDFI